MNLSGITATATAPSTGAAAAAVTGDSLTTLNAKHGRNGILAAWQTNQVAGAGQVSFPSAHDTTRGHRASVPVGSAFLIALGFEMKVQPQEVIAPYIIGSATSGDVEQMTLLLRYSDMPGLDQRLISAAALKGRLEALTTLEASITSGAGPGYSGDELINADSDLLKANRDYALLGFTSRTAVHAIGIKGPDTANARILCPGFLRSELTSGFFPLLSRAYGEPLIPVINSGNKGSTYLFVHTDENAGTFLVTAHLALLR